MYSFGYQQYPPIVTYQQNSRSLESFFPSPGTTNDQSSLSPSTSSPVTPASNRGSVAADYRRLSDTSSYRINQLSHNALGFSGISDTIEQLGFSNQFGRNLSADYGSPSGLSPSKPLLQFAPCHSSMNNVPRQNDYYQSSQNSQGILSPQRLTATPPRNHLAGNTNDMFTRSMEGLQREESWREMSDPHLFYKDGNNINDPSGWTQPVYGSTTHALPQRSELANSNLMHMDDSTMYGDTNTMLGSNMLEYSNLAPTPLRTKCSDCGQEFASKFGPGNLKRHVRLKHRRTEIHSCLQCPKTYKRGDALKKHAWKIHRCREAKPKKRKNRISAENAC